MRVEIWSDIVCPFCYIGKRRFEAALSSYQGRDQVEVIWRSFQLDPETITDTNLSVAQSLAVKKGWSPDQTRAAMTHVIEMAKSVGLVYDFERAVVANTFDAHRLSHLAAQYGRQQDVEEHLFAAYFTEGKNIADHMILTEIGEKTGLNREQTEKALASGEFSSEVRQDLELARQFGISGVPFFVFNRQFAVSGAQDASVFLQALQKAEAAL